MVGTLEEPLLSIVLPSDAQDVRLGVDSARLGLTQHPLGSLVLLGPVEPGEAKLEFVYQIPHMEGDLSLERHFSKRLPLLSVFITDKLSILTFKDGPRERSFKR